MPEMWLYVRWPDHTRGVYYSPSTAITNYFEAGATYALDEFLARSRDALNRASDRVAETYGYFCSSATDQLALIEQAANQFTEQAQPTVRVEKVE